MKALYGIVGVFAAFLIAIIWGGYVFSVLWAWFVVTTFAAPVITVAQAIGATLVLRFAVGNWRTKKEGDHEHGKAMAGAFFIPLLFLGVGWLVKQWLPA